MSLNAQIVVLRYVDHIGGEADGYVTAKQAGMSKGQLHLYRAEAVEAGFLELVERGGPRASNRYRVPFDVLGRDSHESSGDSYESSGDSRASVAEYTSGNSSEDSAGNGITGSNMAKLDSAIAIPRPVNARTRRALLEWKPNSEHRAWRARHKLDAEWLTWQADRFRERCRGSGDDLDRRFLEWMAESFNRGHIRAPAKYCGNGTTLPGGSTGKFYRV